MWTVLHEKMQDYSLKSQLNGISDRSFLSYCDAHSSVTDYRERNVGRGLASVHQFDRR